MSQNLQSSGNAAEMNTQASNSSMAPEQPDEQSLLGSTRRHPGAQGLLSSQVILYLTRGDEGAQSLALLQQANIQFSIVFASDSKRPVAEFGGVSFEGLSGIRDLSRALASLRDIIENGIEAPALKPDNRS